MKATPKGTVSSSSVKNVGSGIEVRAVQAEEVARFESLLSERHYLGEAKPVGDFLRQVALRDGEWVGLLVWGPSAYKLKDRERWIGWSVPQRLERLKLVVQNRRFLLLSPKGAEPNLASQVLGAACKALAEQWLASVHKDLRLCDLCEELAFRTQRADRKNGSSYNSFAFSMLCRQFLERAFRLLSPCRGEFHRSGSLRGYLLQGQRMGSGGHEPRQQPAPA